MTRADDYIEREYGYSPYEFELVFGKEFTQGLLGDLAEPTNEVEERLMGEKIDDFFRDEVFKSRRKKGLLNGVL
jgi:hypothetical protein